MTPRRAGSVSGPAAASIRKFSSTSKHRTNSRPSAGARPVRQADRSENSWGLGEMVLDEREPSVLWRRFGLDGTPPQIRTPDEIGESLGLTRERVRQIENEALDGDTGT